MTGKPTRAPDGHQLSAGFSNLKEASKFLYKDLREWIAEADKLGEIKRLNGLTWEREIGMVTELVLRDDNAPCVIFDEVPGCEKGFRVLTNFFGGKRKNMTVGFPPDFNRLELTEAFFKHRWSNLETIPYEVVDDGPIFENVMEGDDIDVTKFPTPLWHDHDGGRYIGTGSYDVTKDPDSDWINTGTYRVMIHNKKEIGIYISPGKHGRIHRDKYEERGERMPVVVVCGGDPLTFLLASNEAPAGVCEFDMIGGLRGEAMKVVKGKHTGLPFPIDAEIVIEGFIEPGNRQMEGPFGEWTGYYASDTREEPVLTIMAIYHRNDPIILGCPPQRPPDELGRYRAVIRSAMLKENINKAGIPDVTAVWAHECGGARMLVGISIKQRYGGHARQVGHIACQCHVGAYAGKYVVVVDEDIDVSNLEELMWAMVTRSDPATSIDIIPESWSTPLDPRIHPDDKEKKDFRNSRCIIDACRPFHWRDQFPLVNAPSPEVQKEARERWGDLLK
jgi:UbiD family decarboxylase